MFFNAYGNSNRPDTGHLPKEVVVIFPKVTDEGAHSLGYHSVTVTLAGLALPEFAGAVVHPTAQKVLHTSFPAIWDGAAWDNEAEFEALADQIATDWYRYNLSPLDIKFRDIVPWADEGLSDLIEYVYRSDEISTRAQRPPITDNNIEFFFQGGAAVDAPSLHNLLSDTHPDTRPNSPVKGDLITGHDNGSDVKWECLPVGSNGQVPVADSTMAHGIKWVTPGGAGSSLTLPYDLSAFRSLNSGGPVWLTAHHIAFPGIATTNVSSFLGADYLFLVPFFVPTGDTGGTDTTFPVNRMAVYVGTTSGSHNIRMGIYGPTGPNGMDVSTLSLVVDAGAVLLNSGGWRSLSFSTVQLTAGNCYWLACILDSVAAGPTISSLNAGGMIPFGYDETDGLSGLVGYYEARSYGALPATATIEGRLTQYGTASIPAVFLRYQP